MKLRVKGPGMPGGGLRGGRGRNSQRGLQIEALRIHCKRLPHLFEFFHPISGESLKPEIKKLRKLQDVLGEFQDASVATQQLRQHVESVPKRTRKRDRSITRGHLIEGQNRHAAKPGRTPFSGRSGRTLKGISLTTAGFGMGNFNDILVEQLANDGDGAYYYVDTLTEARRVFSASWSAPSGTSLRTPRSRRISVRKWYAATA